MEFKIYQIRNIEECPYSFAGFDFAKNHGLSLEDYKEVFAFNEGTLIISKEELDTISTEALLERIFRLFNRVTQEDCERLEFIGFNGHSLSTGDIVSVNGDLYFCDTFGWEKM